MWTMGKRYILNQGVQVRKEHFGLLFYTLDGPRLYFLFSGDVLNPEFFEGQVSLEEVIKKHFDIWDRKQEKIDRLEKILEVLKEKGVILESSNG